MAKAGVRTLCILPLAAEAGPAGLQAETQQYLAEKGILSDCPLVETRDTAAEEAGTGDWAAVGRKVAVVPQWRIEEPGSGPLRDQQAGSSVMEKLQGEELP